jgi:hypothetical protein
MLMTRILTGQSVSWIPVVVYFLTAAFASRRDVRMLSNSSSNVPPTADQTLNAMGFAIPVSTHRLSTKWSGLLSGMDTVHSLDVTY